MRISTFDEANEILAGYIPQMPQTGTYTLDRIQQLMAALDNPQDKIKIIHVAGTSGKTSTAYYLASFLKQAGQKVGLTISPHIDNVNERVQINLEPLPEKEFGRQLGKFIEIITKTVIRPSYFELLVAFAYWVFAQQKVDYAVIEVGLGGLLDGTNVVSRHDKTCVITDIGLDHTEILGQTLGEIAAQKAGIIHPYNTVFMYEQGEEVMEVVREISRQQQAALHEIWHPPSSELPKHIPLFQRRNWYLANTVFGYLAERDNLNELSDGQLWTTTQTYIPARMEIVEQANHTLIMDGSHNAQKLHALTTSIKKQFPAQPVATLLSLSATSKNQRVRSAIKEITRISDYLIITGFISQQDTVKQAVNPKKIAVICDEIGYEHYEIIANPKEAFAALQQRSEPVHLVTGSFYLLNHIRPIVHKPK
jgi:dihydrofolate synthase / folylpolyglutamate synthase